MKLLLIDRPVEDMAAVDVLRLGPWAFPTAPPDHLPPPDIEPYPDAASIEEGCRRTLARVDQFLPSLSAALVRGGGVESDPGPRFWNIYLSMFLTSLVGIVEDFEIRSRSLRDREFIYGAPDNGEPPPPQQLSDFFDRVLRRTKLRFQITDAALRGFLPGRPERRVRYEESEAEKGPAASRWRPAGQRILFSLVGRLGGGGDSVLLDRAHLRWGDLVKMARLGLPPAAWKRVPPPAEPLRPNWALRDRVFGEFPSPFPAILRYAVPLSFLEGFPAILEKARTIVHPALGKTKRVFSFSLFGEADSVRAQGGLLAADGSVLHEIQHGGGDGIYLTSTVSSIRFKIMDRFLTWGWGPEVFPEAPPDRFRPLPSPYLSGLRRKSPRKSTWRVLLLVFSEDIYPKWIYSPMFPEMAGDYFRRQSVLLDGFRQQRPNAVKLYPQEFGWGQNKWIEGRFPEYERLSRGKFADFAQRSEFSVVDYNSTGFLELVAMNRPFMATWNRRWFQGNTLFEAHLDELKEAGVFFDDATALGHSYRSIQHDLGAWWKEPRRQKALQAMAGKFAWTSASWSDEWREFVRRGSGAGGPRVGGAVGEKTGPLRDG